MPAFWRLSALTDSPTTLQRADDRLSRETVEAVVSRVERFVLSASPSPNERLSPWNRSLASLAFLASSLLALFVLSTLGAIIQAEEGQ
jgi:hypothetical protein